MLDGPVAIGKHIIPVVRPGSTKAVSQLEAHGTAWFEGLLRTLFDGGATVSRDGQHEDMIAFMRSERPDFIQVNYSVIETKAEADVLPLAAELGIAALINRPFMNGSYFGRVRARRCRTPPGRSIVRAGRSSP